jgi:hypothetical protein
MTTGPSRQTANRAIINDLVPTPKAFLQKCVEKLQENNTLEVALVLAAVRLSGPMLRRDSGRL